MEKDGKLTSYILNQYVIKLRPLVKQAKVHTVKHLIRSAEKIRKKKTKNDDDLTKNSKRAERLISEVLTLKGLHIDDISKCILVTKRSFSVVGSDGTTSHEERVIARLADHKVIHNSMKEFRKKYTNWESEIPYLLKVLGLRHRKKKLKSLQEKGKLDSYMNRENRLLLLLHKIGGLKLDERLLNSGSFLTLDDIKLNPKYESMKQKKTEECNKIMSNNEELKETEEISQQLQINESDDDCCENSMACNINDELNKTDSFKSDNSPQKNNPSDNNLDCNAQPILEGDSNNLSTETLIPILDTDAKPTPADDSNYVSTETLIPVSDTNSKPTLLETKLKKKMKIKNKLLCPQAKPKSEVKVLDLSLLINEGKSTVSLETEKSEELSDKEEDFFVREKNKNNKSSFFIGREEEESDGEDNERNYDSNNHENPDEVFDSSVYFRKRKYRDNEDKGKLHKRDDRKQSNNYKSHEQRNYSDKYPRNNNKDFKRYPKEDYNIQKDKSYSRGSQDYAKYNNDGYKNSSNVIHQNQKDKSVKGGDAKASLHPSWAAKKNTNSGICSFQGSRVTFDD